MTITPKNYVGYQRQGRIYAHLADGIPFGILRFFFSGRIPIGIPRLFFGIPAEQNPNGIPMESQGNPTHFFWNPSNKDWNPIRVPVYFLKSYVYSVLFQKELGNSHSYLGRQKTFSLLVSESSLYTQSGKMLNFSRKIFMIYIYIQVYIYLYKYLKYIVFLCFLSKKRTKCQNINRL